MATVSIDQNKCKGCRFCVVSCPKKALRISEETNSKGYLAVTVDGAKCVGCGVCYLMCPDFVFEIRGGE